MQKKFHSFILSFLTACFLLVCMPFCFFCAEEGGGAPAEDAAYHNDTEEAEAAEGGTDIKSTESDENTADIKKPVSVENTADIKKPVSAENTADIEKPVSAEIIADIEKPVSAEDTADHENDEDIITIFVMTDPHYLSPELTDGGPSFQKTVNNGDSKMPQYSDLYMDCFCRAVRESSPDLVLITGDLTYNGARLSHEGFREYCEEIEAAGIPVLVLSGNHDINNPNAVCFSGNSYYSVENVDGDLFQKIWQDYGYSEAAAVDHASGSYLFKLKDDLWILCMDTNSYSDNAVPGSSISWIQQQMAEAERRGARVITASHQNLLRHNSVFYYGFQISNADILLHLFDEYTPLCNLSGHIHLQSIMEEGDLLEIVTGALSVSPNQYGVLTVSDSELSYHTEALDLPEDIREESAAFALSRSEAVLKENLDESLFNEEELKKMKESYLAVNSAYALGEKLDLEPYMEGIKLWESQPANNVSVYFLSLGDSLERERNRIVRKIGSAE